MSRFLSKSSISGMQSKNTNNRINNWMKNNNEKYFNKNIKQKTTVKEEFMILNVYQEVYTIYTFSNFSIRYTGCLKNAALKL
jgi:hypothetical protein